MYLSLSAVDSQRITTDFNADAPKTEGGAEGGPGGVRKSNPELT